MTTRRQLVLDCETTSLTPSYADGSGTIWELATIERLPDGTREEHLWRMKPDLAKADPAALQKGRYYERTTGMRHTDTRAHDLARQRPGRGYWSHPPALAAHLARLLNDVTLLCSVPTFDTGFLTAFLRAHGQAPTWHYRVRDFASIAYGYLTGKPEALAPVIPIGVEPYASVPALDAGTADFAAALGLDVRSYETHTALGDCRLVADTLDIIEGRRVS